MPAIDVNPEQVKATMERESICVVLPTFNNAATLLEVVNATLRYTNNVIVVNDGSTDSTPELLSQLPPEVEIVSYERNRGKGYALKQGFKRARQLGYA
ncbi:MAG: glycosyltransferase, partial [Muribaculaceae bacterium]|nr:glycosyltransferase [Muribaculaceae bacterium]